jgi:predicted ATPase with chaperone activity
MSTATLPIVTPVDLAREPTSIEQTGLDLAFIADLTLKIIYFNNQTTAQMIGDEICLPYYGLLDRALTLLKREELVEVSGSNGFGELSYQYSASSKGAERVMQLLERTTYVGPAPITLERYREMVAHQAISEVRVNPREVRAAMADLVIEESMQDALGQAVNTGRSLFLYGSPGNGKTVIAEHLVPLLGGSVLIPHAITVGGQIIKVLDKHNHQPIALTGRPKHDRRFVLCRRPAIITGGELTMDVLDLIYDKFSRVYEAPMQVKANGGMLMIDDFGRQLVSPRQLLNRWIVPLEKRIDYLTLHTGQKIEVPFDQLIVFSTNLAPRDLVDEAFMRRIQNKIEIGNPSVEAFREIFRRQCDSLGVTYDHDMFIYYLREYYIKPKREMRAVHPRDILRVLIGISRYQGEPPVLTPERLDYACQSYFVEL